MNRLEGTIAFARGSGAIRVVALDTPCGRIHALVLDTGSSERAYVPGGRAAALFKETSVVVQAPGESPLTGRVLSRSEGGVLAILDIALEPSSVLVRAHLPPEELPARLVSGDPVGLRIPASAVALELS